MDQCIECDKWVPETIDEGYCDECWKADYASRPRCTVPEHATAPVLWGWGTHPWRCEWAEEHTYGPIGLGHGICKFPDNDER